MSKHRSIITALALVVFAGIAKADPVAPFGVASAYNLIALGTTGVAGTVSTSADVTGRVAAADLVLAGTTIGSSLNSDPWGSLATFGLVSTNGLVAGQTFNMNGGGNAYAPGTNGHINFNDGGSRVTSGSSGIDFNSLRTSLDLETTVLNGLTANGLVGAPTPPGGNPSWLVLKGTSATLNVFNLTAAQFADTNHNIDIEAPVGSTIIVNVAGTNVTLGTGLYYNGHQYSGDDQQGDNILFNFAGAQTVAGAVFCCFGDRAMYKFAASDSAYARSRANNLVLWHAIKQLIQTGFKVLDFGRTSLANDGLRRFKLSWGAKEELITYVRLDSSSGRWTSCRGDRHSDWYSHLSRHLPIRLNNLLGGMIYPHLD